MSPPIPHAAELLARLDRRRGPGPDDAVRDGSAGGDGGPGGTGGPGGPGDGGDGGDGTSTEVEEEVEESTRLDGGWNVIVWDDPVNLMGYVVYVFQKLFGFSVEKATEHMLEVHNDGKSLVATAPREKGELWVVQLHAYGLQATLERADA